MWVKLPSVLLCLITVLSTTLTYGQNLTYYVSATGNDLANGLSIASAWQTIDKVNAQEFHPGDKVLFEGGQTFEGHIYLDANDAGISSNPVIFSSYGTGKAILKPKGGKVFVAHNAGGLEVHNLIFIGDAPLSGTPNGIDFYMDQTTGDIDHIVIDKVETSGFTGAGIIFSTDPQIATGYSNISVTNSISYDNKYAGLVISGKFTAFNHKNIRIAYCKMYNNKGNSSITTENTGNGIKISSVDGAVIEYCETYQNGEHSNYSNAGPMGMFVYNARNAVIQYCESHHNKTITAHDGGGFSIDGGSINCILQYNYSHDNDGSGFALYQFYNAPAFENNIIRYNISQNDGRKNSYGALSFWGADDAHKIVNCEIYNNTFYLDHTDVSGGTPTAIHLIWNYFSGIKIRNNIFYITNGVDMATANPGYPINTEKVLFENNNYFSTSGETNFHWSGTTYRSYGEWKLNSGQESSKGQSANPQFTNPGSGETIKPAEGGDLTTLTGYQLQKGSPMINAGMNLEVVPNPVNHDFYRNLLSNSSLLDIGAHEYTDLTTVPVTIVSFYSSKSNFGIIIKWDIADENGVSQYEVEKSGDGRNFETIGIVKASKSNIYQFMDTKQSEGTFLYRLRIVDIDKNISYSPVLKHTSEFPVNASVYYHQSGALQITMRNEKEEWIAFHFYDGLGRKIKHARHKVHRGQNYIYFSDLNNWPKGMYRVLIQSDKLLLLPFIK